MDLERVIAALAPTDVVGGAPVEVRSLAYDSRDVTEGALFFCYAGAAVDRHDLAGEAVKRGAVALVVERPLAVAVPQVVVGDARRSMGTVAAEFFEHPSRELGVAAITGTAGKTTTAYLLHAIFEAAGRRPGLLGNIERRVGDERLPAGLNTPEAVDLQRLFREMVVAGNRSCVMEATSEASAQGRLEGTRFAALAFTNLSQEHLNFHGTMGAYFDAKRRLYAQADHAVVNIGDEWGRRLAEELPHAVTFGLAPDAEVRPGVLDDVDFKLRGRFNVENALAAVATARVLGVDEEAITRGLESVRGVPGRLEEIDEGQPFTLVVDYAHKPGALESVLRAAREVADGRVLVVFGAGGDRDRDKRPEMGRIACELADVVVVTSDNPRSEDPRAIIDEILQGCRGEVEVEPERRAAIARAVELAEPGDVVVVAGKVHEQGQEIGGEKIPFDDREVARDLLRALVSAT
jgi:UDP-N-acetylmuramoyl-L-alanyl-D-glutamate--2,6-diaminopimelate ligase